RDCAAGPATASATANATPSNTLTGLLRLLVRRGQRFSREHRVAHRRMVDEAGQNHRGLLQIVGKGHINDIQARMVSSGVVVEGILDELKAGKAHGVEWHVIRTTRVER